jgi:hypothetical protein
MNPASAEGSRASSSETRVVSNGRRVQATREGTRATACIPAMLTHAIVRVRWCTRDLMFFGYTLLATEIFSPASYGLHAPEIGR